MVELCDSRVNILQYDEETLLKEAKEIDLRKIKTLVTQVFDCYNSSNNFCSNLLLSKHLKVFVLFFKISMICQFTTAAMSDFPCSGRFMKY